MTWDYSFCLWATLSSPEFSKSFSHLIDLGVVQGEEIAGKSL